VTFPATLDGSPLTDIEMLPVFSLPADVPVTLSLLQAAAAASKDRARRRVKARDLPIDLESRTMELENGDEEFMDLESNRARRWDRAVQLRERAAASPSSLRSYFAEFHWGSARTV
jgi:hypothetical protein